MKESKLGRFQGVNWRKIAISLIYHEKGEGKAHACIIDSITMSAPTPE
jgi:hypothetical protein